MQKKHWYAVGGFVVGTFVGGTVFRTIGRLFGRASR